MMGNENEAGIFVAHLTDIATHKPFMKYDFYTLVAAYCIPGSLDFPIQDNGDNKRPGQSEMLLAKAPLKLMHYH